MCINIQAAILTVGTFKHLLNIVFMCLCNFISLQIHKYKFGILFVFCRFHSARVEPSILGVTMALGLVTLTQVTFKTKLK